MLCAVVPLVVGLDNVSATEGLTPLVSGEEIFALVGRVLPDACMLDVLEPRAGL